MVGSHLLFELASKGRKIRALRRAGSYTELVKRLFVWYDADRGEDLFNQVEWVEGDLLDIVSLQDSLKGVDCVYHCAAVVSFMPDDRHIMLKANVEGTANLVNVALANGVKKFCHCSSVAALGSPDQGSQVNESLVWKTSKNN